MRLTVNTLDVARLPVVLTVGQYAAIMQMKPPTVRKLLRDGEITGARVGRAFGASREKK